MAGNDEIYTPGWVVDDIVKHFDPKGMLLDPCRGMGAFSSKMPGCQWCEIKEGVDFIDFEGSVDWCISNPPYSKLNLFTRKAIEVSDNVIWLIPVWKIYQAYGLVKAISNWGAFKEIRWYGTGSSLGFPMGNGIGAVHMQKNCNSDTKTTFAV